MEKNVFGYLLIPRKSLSEYAVIARDYWHSTVEMGKENSKNKAKYCCAVVCLNCSWWQRKRLSMRTGIPMKAVANVYEVNNRSKKYLDFETIVAVDSMVDDAFFGRTKVYASEEEIPRGTMNPCIEVVYAK